MMRTRWLTDSVFLAGGSNVRVRSLVDIFTGSEGVAKAVLDGSHPRSVVETSLTESGAFESEPGTPSKMPPLTKQSSCWSTEKKPKTTKTTTDTGVVLQPTDTMMWSFVVYILLPFGLNAFSITSRWMQRPD